MFLSLTKKDKPMTKQDKKLKRAERRAAFKKQSLFYAGLSTLVAMVLFLAVYYVDHSDLNGKATLAVIVVLSSYAIFTVIENR